MTRADLIEAVRTASGKPYLSERECLAIVRGVLGVVREPTRGMLNACPVVGTGPDEHGNWSINTKPAEAMWPAMIDALLGEISDTR
jgi:hypothetical protein